jgi:hypothetical protein
MASLPISTCYVIKVQVTKIVRQALAQSQHGNALYAVLMPVAFILIVQLLNYPILNQIEFIVLS